MKNVQLITAALVIGGVIAVVSSTSKRVKAYSVPNVPAPLPSPSPIKPSLPSPIPVKPPSRFQNGVFSLPDGLEPYRTIIEWSCGQNKIRVSLFGALCERENRTFDPTARRFEAGLLVQPWFNVCLLKNGTWTPGQFASSYGLTQILAATAVCDLGWNGNVDTIIQPKTNIELGARYLAKCLKQQNGNLLLALVRYNGGGGAVAAVNGSSLAHPSYEYALDVLAREKRIIAARG
jgi:hypothetical protein